MNELQSAVESFDNRLNQAEKRIRKLKNQPWEIIQLKEKKEKAWNTVKKPTVIGHHEVNHVGVPEEERGGQRDYLNKQCLKTSWNWGKKYTSASKEPKEPQIG